MSDDLALRRARYWSVNSYLAGTPCFRFALFEDTLMREHGRGEHPNPLLACPLCQVETAARIQAWKDDGTISPFQGHVRFTRKGVEY